MLYNIQYLRFAAATLVVLYHSATRIPANDSVFRYVFSVGESVGFAGVDVFFVISGFIMAHTTVRQSGAGNSFDFARRRLARIFSGYWPFFILAVVLFSQVRPDHFAKSNLLKSFFLWPQSLNHVLLEITWTLSYELYFYLLFSVLILFFKPLNRYRVVLLAAIGLTGLNLYYHFVAHSFSPENLYSRTFAAQFLTSPFLLEFFAGVLIAWWLARKPSGPAFSWFFAGTALFLFGGWINESLYSGLIEQGYHVVPRVFIYGLPASMMLMGLVRIETAGHHTPVAFSSLGGGASYAIYLSHILILNLAWSIGFNELISGWSGNMVILAYGLLVVAILALSMLHFTYIEKPLHQLFKRSLGL